MALGGILTHLSRKPLDGARYQPSNITWAHVAPLVFEGKKLKKRDRYDRLAERAIKDLAAFAAEDASRPAPEAVSTSPSL